MIRWLQNSNIGELIKDGTHIIDFYAEWCVGSKTMTTILQELESEYNLDIIRVNVDLFDDVGKKFKVVSLPTTIFMKDGQIVKEVVGTRSKDQFINIINEINK